MKKYELKDIPELKKFTTDDWNQLVEENDEEIYSEFLTLTTQQFRNVIHPLYFEYCKIARNKIEQLTGYNFMLSDLSDAEVYALLDEKDKIKFLHVTRIFDFKNGAKINEQIKY